MIIYNPNDEELIKERLEEGEKILTQINAKHCFITGSFLSKKKFNDIDVFVITRKKEEIRIYDKRVKITKIDFNDLYSLFYHSISKSCISKNLLPRKPLKVTLSDYWGVVNEAVPTLMNQKDKYHKDIRFLILYAEYFKSNMVLDTFELNKKIEIFKDHKEILEYIQKEIPPTLIHSKKKSYLKRFFYTQTGLYKELFEYKAQKFLYNLIHEITRGING